MMKYALALFLTFGCALIVAVQGDCKDWDVPADALTIVAAIDSADVNTGDRVVVSNKDDGDPTVAWEEIILLESGVPVVAADGQSPIIEAQGVNPAVLFPANATSGT